MCKHLFQGDHSRDKHLEWQFSIPFCYSFGTRGVGSGVEGFGLDGGWIGRVGMHRLNSEIMLSC